MLVEANKAYAEAALVNPNVKELDVVPIMEISKEVFSSIRRRIKKVKGIYVTRASKQSLIYLLVAAYHNVATDQQKKSVVSNELFNKYKTELKQAIIKLDPVQHKHKVVQDTDMFMLYNITNILNSSNSDCYFALQEVKL